MAVRMLALVMLASSVAPCRGGTDASTSPDDRPVPVAVPAVTMGRTLAPPGGVRSELVDDPGRGVVLPPGAPVVADVRSTDGEAWGIEVVFEVRPRDVVPPPVNLGAIVAANAAARKGSTGTLRATVAEGRLRARFAGPGFPLVDGQEMRAAAGYVGALFVLPGPTSFSSVYRVIAPGALRSLLNELRADVVPLAATSVTPLARGSRFGRATQRATITTSYGTVTLEQVATPAPPATPHHAPQHGDLRPDPRPDPRPDSRPDARAPDARGETARAIDQGGELLCRLVLDLVAADRALAGPPCSPSTLPVFAEVAYASGGGIVLDAATFRDVTVPREDLAFPPTGARLGLLRPPPADGAMVDPDALLAMRPRGDAGELVVANRSTQPRAIFIDGVPARWLAPARELGVPLRRARYIVAWRSLIGEAVEPPSEVSVPGRTVTGQPVGPSLPSPSASASPMASARTGP